MKEAKDYYELLGVNQRSSAEEIKKSYKKLARKYHPDNKETGNEELFKQIGQAYSILSDSQKKSFYDQVGHTAFINNNGASQRTSSPFDQGSIFNDLEDFLNMFGASAQSASTGSKRRKRKVNGSDIQVVLEVDFLEAIFGVEKELEINRQKTCPTCQGTGADPSSPPEDCSVCKGEGEIRKTSRSFLGMVTQVQTCYNCNGTGKIIKSFCKTCKGKKQIKSKEKLKVKIPEAIEEGTRLFWESKGNEGLNGGINGDLYILIKVQEHSKFTRRKLDIWTEKEISLSEAIKGEKIKIETIHGEEDFRIKPGTQSGTVLTLKNKGVSSSGNHKVKIKVEIPSKEQISEGLLEKLEEELGNKNRGKNNKSRLSNFFKR